MLNLCSLFYGIKKSHCEALSVVDIVGSKLNMAVNLTQHGCELFCMEDWRSNNYFKMGCVCWSELQLKCK